MKGLTAILVIASFVLGSCARPIDSVSSQSSSPATVSDANEFAKKYDVSFKPADNFNPDKKISKDDLEKLFIKWSKRQASILTPEQKAVNRAYDAFFSEVKNVKSRKEYYQILDKHPVVKTEMITRMGGVERFNSVMEENLQREQAR